MAAALLSIPAACTNQVPPSIGDRAQAALAHVQRHPQRAVCSTRTAPGQKRCHMHVRLTDDGSRFYDVGAPSGFGPPDLISAYNLSSAPSPTGVTVAVVDAFDDPNAESDLAAYRAQYGLPACTSANGCFKKIGQDGSTNLPPADTEGWATEISLDVDMVSAICPSCNILLVEATSDSGDDLYIANNAAAAAGAQAISNSWGGAEDGTGPTDDSYFNHPGILTTASAGDDGTGASYPATSPYVLAVGGTSLVQGGGARGWSETAWSDTGSGCSAYEAQPAYQVGVVDSSVCGLRMEADVSAVADPNTGVAVYCTYGGASSGCTGWLQVGGTSASSPIVASVFTRLGGTSAAAQPAGWPYANSAAFYDVTSGSNGSCTNIICQAGAGYDGPTGWGTPNAEAILAALTGSSGGGSGGSSGGGSGGSSGGGSGGSSGSCDHSICALGDALETSCDPCVVSLCARDSYCCTTAWDSVCVGEVPLICGETCTSGGAGGSGGAPDAGVPACTHSECSTGSNLVSGCDACVSTICAEDTYCCDTTWDDICVEEATLFCGTCN